ncbi:MAG TPA: tetratricopeptide repeat protein, partial [Candidatus Wallbacteria bacterium]|nr:tetratricopeptide repeat protein [Candidatus Wallbacteria bacterium]
VNKGAILNRLGKFKDGAELLKSATDKFPNSSELHLNLAVSYEKLSQNDDSTAENGKATAINSSFNIMSFPNGISLGAMTKYDDESLPQIENKSPQFAGLSLTSTVSELDQKLKTKLNQVHGAAESGKTGVATPEEAYLAGETLYKKAKYDEAMAEYKKAIELKKDYFEAFEKLGLCLAELGKYEDAIEFLSKCVAIKPDYAQGYVNLGKTFGVKGDRAKEIEMLKKAISLDAKNSDAYYSIGLSYKSQGKKKEALEALQKYVEVYPDSPKKDMIESLIEQLK